jgi:DNA-binding response OmpR family regulator
MFQLPASEGMRALIVEDYDIAVLDRDILGPAGDEIAKRILASGSGMPILMLTAADRLDDRASEFRLGADDHVTKPSNAVRVTVSALGKCLGEPWIIASAAGAGCRIDSQQDSEPEAGDRG